jgi:hypothetical protein
VDLPLLVADQDHRFAAHPRGEEVTRIGDLALMPDKQPGASEELFEFLGKNPVIDEDLAADNAALGIDQPIGRVHRITHSRAPFTER